jgi:histidinol-phosphate aminotransferase
MNSTGIEYLTRELSALGLQTWPTDANYLLVEAGAGVYEKLLKEGVIVRPMQAFGLPDHIRISIGLPAENERFIEALRKLGVGGAA